ncbi:MAG: class I SAM-dependent methyltransferase [Patescibacteria group bacterium]
MKTKHSHQIIAAIKKSYNSIAEHFSQTRQYNWNEIKSYVKQYARAGQNILDLGCGNGRLYQILSPYSIDYLGVDISQKLIAEAKSKYPTAQWQIDDMSQLKLPSNYYHIVFAIASFHHLPNEILRQQVVDNIFRALKPGGLFIMTNWNLYQPKYKKYFNKDHRFDKNLAENDTLIPWKNSAGQILTTRYYHAFTLSEIDKILSACQFQVIENKKNRFNLVTVAKKLRITK